MKNRFFDMAFVLVFHLVTLFPAFSHAKVPEMQIEEITQNVYLHRSYHFVDGYGVVGSNGLIVVDNDQAFLVDTAWSSKDTEKLVLWIKQKGLHLEGSVSTHSHEDRTAGIDWLNKNGIPTYASAKTNQLLKAQEKPLAKNTFAGTEAKLMDGAIRLYFPGKGHAADNIVLWLPRDKILFGGCLVRSLASKTLGYTGEASIEDWPQSISNTLAKFPTAETVVPGHGEIGDQKLLNHTKDLAVEKSAKR